MSKDETFEIPDDIDKSKIPNHIAIIMDGNGSWAKQRNLPRHAGHKEGQKALKVTVKNCAQLGIKVLTVYAFSTENWSRPKKEISFLLTLLKNSINNELSELIEENVQLKFLGDLSKFDSKLISSMKKAEEKTNKNTRLQLNVMINYGGRNEIINAIKSYVNEGNDIQCLSENALSQHMYTSGCNDPDIFIRTSGTVRVSNFLLWQCSYSEFIFIDTLWPDFNMSSLLTIIREYQSRDRRFGGLNE